MNDPFEQQILHWFMNLPKHTHGAVHDEPCLCAKYKAGRIQIDDCWHGICLDCGSLRGKALGEGATISAEQLRKVNDHLRRLQ